MVNKKDPPALLRKGPKRGGKKTIFNLSFSLYFYYRLYGGPKLLFD